MLLCEQHGYAVVWSRAIEMFGFPPTWGLQGSQLARLGLSFLNSTNGG